MRRYVFDVEADGLLDTLTRIHSLVVRDVGTGEIVASCTDDDPSSPPIRHGLSLLSEADTLYGHNLIHFDLPALQKVYPDWTYRGKVRDTMLLAQLWKADIAQSDWTRIAKRKMPKRLAGRHSLEAWGYRLGIHKDEYTDWCAAQGIDDPWSTWRPEMQTYCEQDTAVTLALIRLLRRAPLSLDAVDTEHRLAFYLAAMERNGFPFNVSAAEELVAKLSARRAQLEHELRAVFKPWIVDAGPFTPKRNNRKMGYYGGCPATRIKIVEFKPSSRDHIVGRLKALYGWEPVEFTENGNPKMDDDVMSALPYPEAPKLAEYLLVQKRLGQLSEGKESWLKHLKAGSHWGGKLTGLQHVHGRINQLGAVTHRATHSKPNMSQVPKVKADKDGNLLWAEAGDWSTDFRNLWTVPRGWKLLGADASGLELRCLAHYMARYDGGAYAEIVLHGDVHSANRDALGLAGKAGRDIAKTFIYAFLYGAGDELLGRNIEPTATPQRASKLGAELRAKFLSGLPALGRLSEDVKERANANGYLTILDGRRVAVRHDHAVLNTLLQSTGSVICKRWLVELDARLTRAFGPQGWRGRWAALVWSHDEKQTAVRPEIAEDAAQIAVASIEHMTQHFKFRCPLTGEAKIGGTWAETH